MASGEQLKALLKSHADGDDDRFFSVAMQVAADEARRGHGSLAEELRTLIDCAKSKPGAGAPVPIGRPRGELANLLEASHPSARLGQMVLSHPSARLGQMVLGETRGPDPRRQDEREGSTSSTSSMPSARSAGSRTMSARSDAFSTAFCK